MGEGRKRALAGLKKVQVAIKFWYIINMPAVSDVYGDDALTTLCGC